MVVQLDGEALLEQAEEVARCDGVDGQTGRDVDTSLEVRVQRLAQRCTETGIGVDV